MDSLFDQSALTALAERLIKAARAAGADAADAVAMRSVSQSVEVRDGAVEESRALRRRRHGPSRAGRAQAGGGLDQRHERRRRRRRWPSARWRWRASRPRTSTPASPTRRCWRRTSPISIWSIRELPDVAALEAMARRAEEAGRAVKGVSKSGGASASAGIGGMVLLTSHGFSGAYLGSRHGISMQAIAGEGTGDGDRLRLLLGAARRRSRCAGEDRPQRRREGGGAAQSAQGLDHEGAGGVRLRASRARSSAIWSAPSTARRSRARRASSRTSSASGFSRRASTSSTIRCAAAACARGRSTPKASPARAWR